MYVFSMNSGVIINSQCCKVSLCVAQSLMTVSDKKFSSFVWVLLTSPQILIQAEKKFPPVHLCREAGTGCRCDEVCGEQVTAVTGRTCVTKVPRVGWT